ncbi:DUF938 domain-containing protein [Shewanella morhuae]|uniref:Protein of uncharacterized function (DUF938) n=1 Tax=Shewanella morhuae TaxID=365591 RepID=A0A379ZTQ8_9GAMM|nr:DUF938 domain-containing protein [Shewanella morhuae]SUI68047.1 Protein of uncharacterised function (DUF938) [Shewanella morhuae]
MSLLPIIQAPFSQACENNKAPILAVLTQAFSPNRHVLEIGSGTGQHAVYFAANLPHLIWQTSDQAEYIGGVTARCEQENTTTNLVLPLILDVTAPWPVDGLTPEIDAVFSANTLHIMSKNMVEAFFNGLGLYLPQLNTLCIYGPFNYQGEFSSDSNRQFDGFLKQRDPASGIRDIEWICCLASEQGLTLQQDVAMPANNRLLQFVRD